MTTEYYDNTICTFKIFIVVAFPTRNSVLDDFPLCPQGPPPLKNQNFYFYCRLAVSEKVTPLQIRVNFESAATLVTAYVNSWAAPTLSYPWHTTTVIESFG